LEAWGLWTLWMREALGWAGRLAHKPYPMTNVQ
jgi:hypothetical protein